MIEKSHSLRVMLLPMALLFPTIQAMIYEFVDPYYGLRQPSWGIVMRLKYLICRLGACYLAAPCTPLEKDEVTSSLPVLCPYHTKSLRNWSGRDPHLLPSLFISFMQGQFYFCVIPDTV